jgi:hypothetical protein
VGQAQVPVHAASEGELPPLFRTIVVLANGEEVIVPPPRLSNATGPSLSWGLRQSIHRFRRLTMRATSSASTTRGSSTGQFQSAPINNPLLKSLSGNLTKPAWRLFRSILVYSGADFSAAGNVEQMVELFARVNKHVQLQLIKQTRENPIRDCEAKTWEILLVGVTAFPPARESEAPIREYLLSPAPSTNERIADLHRFTTIHLRAR